ncbi:MAG: hypothetical protein RDV41_12790 [Planctomycetota bacterium]|nr:hypothetical protein [Planctomycetota bacterium]
MKLGLGHTCGALLLLSLSLMGMLILSLSPVTVCAQEPPAEGNADQSPPPADEQTVPPAEQPTTKVKKPWITLLDVSSSFNGEKLSLKIAGATSLPDGALIDFGVKQQGFAADSLLLSTRAMNKVFETKAELDRKLLPGYYVVTAQCAAERQDEALRSQMAPVTNVKAILPLAVGTPEEIDKLRETSLETYGKSVDFVADTFEQMKKKYLELVELGDKWEAGKRWNAEFEKLPDEIAERRNALENLKTQYLHPPLPMVQYFVVEGLCLLDSVHSDLTHGLVADIQHELTDPGITQMTFLEWAEKEISGFLKGMQLHFMMERNAALRDLLVHQVKDLFFLLEESRDAFDSLSKGEQEAGKEAWSARRAEWDAELTELDRTLAQHKKSELAKDYPELARALLEVPGALREFWKLCGLVLVDGEPLQKHLDAINNAYLEAFKRVVPVMEILGFSREAYNEYINTSNREPR